jgi:hypothetical protein
MIIPIKASVTVNHNKLFRLYAKLRSLFSKPMVSDYRTVPVIINNFNRLEYLKQMISWFELAGMKNIYIIDNLSTYQPLLEFYKKTKYTVFKLDKNVGHMALWQTHIFMLFKNRPYIYTDPDIVPVEECPLNAVAYFWELLQQYPDFGRAGFGLKIDDLPNHYPLKQKVMDWESQYWNQDKQIQPGVYDATIDTTFALYRANAWGDAGYMKSLRTSGKYLARHLPWYIDPANLDEEEIFFLEHSGSVSSWYAELRGEKTNY